MSGTALAAFGLGAACGAGAFLLLAAVLGMRSPAPGPGRAWRHRLRRDVAGPRVVVAVAAGLATLAATRWVVGGVAIALLTLAWRGLGGAAGERRALARLESLANWTESLRDTIAGAVGLEQAIPASLRVAAPALTDPLGALVARLRARVPMAEALRGFAEDLADPAADLIVAALVINAQLRGPGLRDLLGALSGSVREELDLRRRVFAERRSTRRSAQIVVGVSVGLTLALAVFDRGYVRVYDSAAGQLVLTVVAALYAGGLLWMRSLARFDAPARLFADAGPARTPAVPEAVATWRGDAP